MRNGHGPFRNQQYASPHARIRKEKNSGNWDTDTLKIEPTVMDFVTWDDKIMGEEIFGLVLPVLTYDKIDDVIEAVNSHDQPLAQYIFAEDKSLIRRVTSRCSFGGGCVNDCIVHLATSNMEFGGVGESGMGAYHGKAGFETFSHYKSIVDKKTWMDLPIRYQPYSKLGDWLIHKFLRQKQGKYRNSRRCTLTSAAALPCRLYTRLSPLCLIDCRLPN